MTGEEMEPAIEFLLKSQVNLEAQIAETGRQLSAYAETQSQFIQITARNIDASTAAFPSVLIKILLDACNTWRYSPVCNPSRYVLTTCSLRDERND